MANYERHHQLRTYRRVNQRNNCVVPRRPFRDFRMGLTVAVEHQLQDHRATQESVGQTDRGVMCAGQHTRRRRNVTETHRPRSWGGDVTESGSRVCGGGYGFPYTAAVYFSKALAGNWRHLRAQFALTGIDWRSWSAADQASVSYLLLQRQYATDKASLRDLYELAGDKEAVAEIDRSNMGQPPKIETTR